MRRTFRRRRPPASTIAARSAAVAAAVDTTARARAYRESTIRPSLRAHAIVKRVLQLQVVFSASDRSESTLFLRQRSQMRSARAKRPRPVCSMSTSAMVGRAAIDDCKHFLRVFSFAVGMSSKCELINGMLSSIVTIFSSPLAALHGKRDIIMPRTRRFSHASEPSSERSPTSNTSDEIAAAVTSSVAALAGQERVRNNTNADQQARRRKYERLRTLTEARKLASTVTGRTVRVASVQIANAKSKRRKKDR